ncbi:hypothetical protein [Paludisphaera mucosa]|uniref:Uncharacterized protein n=1 Tax=Paludisphaera mucosa TaxID=3030827 RepID=A0ABT6FKQ7_9BACT|nr:hypothetical protein [Paludisphaera mucosa]MDG3007975.1 hypothetical protein [Paludisphaera mucosa]
MDEGVEGASVMAPTGKLVFMVLLLCLQDGASEVHFQPYLDEGGDGEPCDDPYEDGASGGLRYRLWYVINGELHDLVAPPRHLAPAIADELKRLAGLKSWRGRLAGRLRAAADRLDGRPPAPDSGTFRIGTAEWSIEVAATFHSTVAGDWSVLAFRTAGVDPSTEAQEQLRRMMEARRKARGETGEQPAPDAA